jgi:predicted acylesterase/phospholipase RssA
MLQTLRTRVTRVLAFGVAAASLMLAGCAGTLPRDVVPAALAQSAAIPHLPEVRFWGDEKSKALDQSLSTRVDQIVRSGRAKKLTPTKKVNVDFLALSGGGGDGAFGAGVLIGWSEHGTRPKFEIVTGVSTGALMSPFAFLGPEYDPQLKEMYTTLSTKQLVTFQFASGLLGGNAVADSAPLAAQIARHVDRKMLAAVAGEHAVGRRLFVATTNIDAQRPVIWDMGAIAQSNHPDSLELFRQVLLASASIPGIFPPVRIKVRVEGKDYEELHVDGGTTNQVFFLPFDAVLDSYARNRLPAARFQRRLFVIRNTKVAPEWSATPDKTLPIVERSLATLTKSQGVGDLYKLYLEARIQKMEFNYAAIPPDFVMRSNEPFDLVYMNALYDRGYALGRAGYNWEKTPPGLPSRLAE